MVNWTRKRSAAWRKGSLISTGKKELEDMIQDGKPVTVNCQFCENSYVFSVEDLQSLLQRAGG